MYIKNCNSSDHPPSSPSASSTPHFRPTAPGHAALKGRGSNITKGGARSPHRCKGVRIACIYVQPIYSALLFLPDATSTIHVAKRLVTHTRSLATRSRSSPPRASADSPQTVSACVRRPARSPALAPAPLLLLLAEAEAAAGVEAIVASATRSSCYAAIV